MIDQNFLEKLPDDPLNIIKTITQFVMDRYTNKSSEQHWNDYEFYIESYGLFQAFAEANNLKYSYPALGTDKHRNMEQIVQFLNETKSEAEKELTDMSLATAKEKYSVIFANSFYYEFTDGDLKRIQEPRNEIRNLTTSSLNFEAEHRQRILKRLEKLQKETIDFNKDLMTNVVYTDHSQDNLSIILRSYTMTYT